MDNKLILEAVNAIIRNNKIVNLHVRLPADELSDGGVLFECDTCDNLFLNSQNHWVKFYVRIYPSDLSMQPQDIDKETGGINASNKNDAILLRIAYRIYTEYKRVVGK